MDKKFVCFIICCKCGDTPTYSKEAYKVIRNKHKQLAAKDPAVFYTKTDVKKLLNSLKTELPNSSNAVKYIEALLENKEKYAIYFELNLDGSPHDAYDLFTGKQIK